MSDWCEIHKRAFRDQCVSCLVDTATAALRAEVEKLRDLKQWLSGAVTELAVGDIKSGSLLHHKLRNVMIAYCAAERGEG